MEIFLFIVMPILTTAVLLYFCKYHEILGEWEHRPEYKKRNIPEICICIFFGILWVGTIPLGIGFAILYGISKILSKII